ncbi:hypothetical protein OHD50_02920 [Escherichia coli]|nr:hypothetical protein [Escherichia coli]
MFAVAKAGGCTNCLHEAGVADNVICFEAQIPLALSRAALRARVEECWHLTEQMPCTKPLFSHSAR